MPWFRKDGTHDLQYGRKTVRDYMKKLTILIDMDDTMETLLDAWVKWLNKKYGRNVTCEDVTDWDVTKAYPGLTKAEAYDPLNHPEIWDDVRPIEGSVEGIKHFIDCGHKVMIVTASNYETLAAKMDKVLFKYYPFIKWDDVIITSNKQLIKGDVLIDDGFHNLEGGDFYKILVDAPYNRSCDAKAAGMVRVYNWDEIVHEVDKLTLGDGN